MTILPNEVHLWCVFDEEITSPALLEKYHKLLNQEEKAQHKRFFFEKHRHQYLLTRVLVRTVLSHYMPENSPKDWRFDKNKYGKPSVINSSLALPVEFNISHSDKLVVLAITNGVEIGVDVEYVLRDRKIIGIIDSCFSVQEIEDLKSLGKEVQYERFFDLWTMKEAYIKARGKGLSIPLDQFSYQFSENNKISIEFDNEHIRDDPRNWRFWNIRPNNTHKISIALREEDISKEYFIKMHKITPLQQTEMVNYPVIMTG